MLKQYLEAGKIVGTHGIKGELRMEYWTDSPSFFLQIKALYLEEGARKCKILSVRPHKNLVLLKLEGVDTVEDGDLLRGKTLYFDRNDIELPEGRYYIQDILGVTVQDADTGKVYGTLTDVIRTGANDVYQVTDEAKKDYLVPAIDEVIVTVDPEHEKMEIRPMRGIFDDVD